MEHTVSTTDTIINILIQVFNIALFFFLFIKFAGKSLTDALHKKIEQEKKLADADKEYAALIADAMEKKESILAEALAHKKTVLAEAKTLAEQEREKMLEKASREAKLLLEKAEKDIAAQKHDNEQYFEYGVKQSALAMVKKLFASNKQASDTYVSGLVDEFTASYKSH